MPISVALTAISRKRAIKEIKILYCHLLVKVTYNRNSQATKKCIILWLDPIREVWTQEHPYKDSVFS